MKKSILLAMFVMISATVIGQFAHVNSVPQVWNNTPTFPGHTHFTYLILNGSNNMMQSYTSPVGTLLASPVTASTETISTRNYDYQGAYIGVITASDARDTINLIDSIYNPNQLINFVSYDAVTTHTVVIMPNSGTINGAAFYPLTGTAYKSLSTYYDGANFFILNKQ